jgi:hypothetical protein
MAPGRIAGEVKPRPLAELGEPGDKPRGASSGKGGAARRKISDLVDFLTTIPTIPPEKETGPATASPEYTPEEPMFAPGWLTTRERDDYTLLMPLA